MDVNRGDVGTVDFFFIVHANAKLLPLTDTGIVIAGAFRGATGFGSDLVSFGFNLRLDLHSDSESSACENESLDLRVPRILTFYLEAARHLSLRTRLSNS